MRPERERIFRGILTPSTPAVVLDGEGRILRFNRAQKTTGYTARK
jgi:hypothetical protein